jgi:hypothetical protein
MVGCYHNLAWEETPIYKDVGAPGVGGIRNFHALQLKAFDHFFH